MEAAAAARKDAVITRATVQTRNPWAVSRKYTSCVWIVAHLVRSRPAKYPPMAEAMICMAINQTMAPLPTAEADAPTFDHGEIEDRPSPVPRSEERRVGKEWRSR